MDSQGSQIWSNNFETWNPLMEDPIDTRMGDGSESLERQWPYAHQFASGEMPGIPIGNASNGHYSGSLYNSSPTYDGYSTSTSWSASPLSHLPPSTIPPVRILSQTSTLSMQTSSWPYQRSNSGASLDAMNFSPVETTSSYSSSMAPMSREHSNDMPMVPGHGLLSNDGQTLKCICGTEFNGAKAKNSRSNFKRHLKSQGTVIPCLYCPKKFNRQDNAQQHVRTHHNEMQQ